MSDVKTLFKAIKENKKSPRIKLLGDSITHGVGGDGFAQNGQHIVDEFSRNPDGYCWANLFRDHMKEKHGADVQNNACTGTKIEFVIDNFEKLVDDGDDLVICTIGTNNRHKFFVDGDKPTKEGYLDEFYKNIIKLNGLFEKSKKNFIFVANIPAAPENEADSDSFWRIFHMDDVNDAYKKAHSALGFNFISMYDLFNEYCKNNATTVGALLDDGLHPNNEGHRVIFKLLTEALGA